jgi:pimeloyl-ACP methyl ester carboxylesterase
MSLFCLVHGSTQNASCWDLLVTELERNGHDAVRMNLPTNEPDGSATRYADVIAEAIPPHREDAIVVAHSASGLFLPLVPQKRRVRRLVFLAAVIPQIGKSLLDQVNNEKDMFNPEWLGEDPTKDDQLALRFLFHDCSPERSTWALSTMSLMFARQAILEVCPVSVWPDVPSSYIVCSEDRTIQPQWSRRAARKGLGVVPIELPGGHCPYVSRPAELAHVLASLGQLNDTESSSQTA